MAMRVVNVTTGEHCRYPDYAHMMRVYFGSGKRWSMLRVIYVGNIGSRYLQEG